MRPTTLAGQMLELRAALCDVLADLALRLRLPDVSARWRRRALEFRREWQNLERIW